jgi:signal transduction histidine kinase
MNLRAVENKARLAMALFVLALLLTIGLSLALYSQSRQEVAAQRVRQIQLEATLLAARLREDQRAVSDASLRNLLTATGVKAAVAVYSTGDEPVARASSIDRQPQPRLLSPTAPSEQSRGTGVVVRTEGEFNVAEVVDPAGLRLVIVEPNESEKQPVIFYVFSYQIVALVFGLGLVFLLARWLVRPYRRMVDAARGSPVRAATAAVSESEFVVETFQALIEQLHSKERELARLHALERRRAERSERFSERLIANIPSGLVTIDSAGTVTSANAQGLAIFAAGEPVAKADGELVAVGVDYREFFRGAPRMVELVGECLVGGAAFRREEVDVTHSDGRVRHLGLSLSPMIDASHRVEGALCLMTDLTEVIELRERMKLQENLANLGEMAAGLAHEFKNSLATIQGYVQLLDAQTSRSISPVDQKPAYEAALNEVKLLARLVTDFLNFARPQKLNLTQVNLREIAQECADELQPQLAEAGIELKITGRFASLPADEAMVKRAFLNLLRNAAEAIEPHSRERFIEVTGSVESGTGGRYAHVHIRDTGGGISPSDLHNIFIPFFTTKSRGYGIGLAIVQKILVAHGGDVAVERSDSAGTVFHCRLPLNGPTGVMEPQ